ETILQAISKRQITVTDLITERVALIDYLSIYNNLGKGSIASILEYTPDQVQEARSIEVVSKTWQGNGKGIIGIIGAGNFT
ncbi:hypothetical protein WB403_51525, partial [Streptomyces brasiliscabiei]